MDFANNEENVDEQVISMKMKNIELFDKVHELQGKVISLNVVLKDKDLEIQKFRHLVLEKELDLKSYHQLKEDLNKFVQKL